MMRIGEIFRYSRPYDPDPEFKDGLPNYFYHASTKGCRLPLLESGINPIQKVETLDGVRCPAILISSSPHKIGSEKTPWQDYFDPDHGHIRYFGDNKSFGRDPAEAPGNKALLEQFVLHTSPNITQRKKACPIIFFKRVAIEARAKGNVMFQGFGVIGTAERITQFDRWNQLSFTNYVFDFVVFSMIDEHEQFNWQWISNRRDVKHIDDDVFKYAPASWCQWVKEGTAANDKCRRRIVKLLTVSSYEQQPPSTSREYKALFEIYDFYIHRKNRFEALAALIAGNIIQGNGHRYIHGWITPATSDGGADFIGRLDIGTGFSKAKLIVLGQAKCEKIDVPTGGNHIARTVARLKRGWLGVYVTTSYFSETVQREILEDKYPILLVNGQTLASEVLRIAHEQGFPNITAFLKHVDLGYEERIRQRDPEEILYE